jgi:hypothetical protein
MDHSGETIHQSQQAQQGARLPEMNYPQTRSNPPKPAPDQPVFGVLVPNYNAQRPRVQNKKNAVAMGLRATLAQSDISTKLAIAAKTTAW